MQGTQKFLTYASGSLMISSPTKKLVSTNPCWMPKSIIAKNRNTIYVECGIARLFFLIVGTIATLAQCLSADRPLSKCRFGSR